MDFVAGDLETDDKIVVAAVLIPMLPIQHRS